MRVSTAGLGSSPIFSRLLGEMPPGIVLNLGAGSTGAVDQPQRLVNVDHARPQGARPPGLLVVADAHRLPFASGVFVGILAKDVLEHVADPIGVLAELRRTSQDGGRLLLVVPRAIPRAVWDDPTHIRGFTDRALRTALQLSGWTGRVGIGRIGGLPGARRLGLDTRLETVMKIPGLGHWYGRNWIARTVASSSCARP